MKMRDFKILQSVLIGDLTAREGMTKYDLLLRETDSKYLNRIFTSYRVLRDLFNLEKGIAGRELSVNLRQAILNYNEDLKENLLISNDLYRNIQHNIRNSGINIVEINEKKTLSVDKSIPVWFEHDARYYNLYSSSKPSRTREEIGDFHLKNMTGYDTYKSNTQKILVDAAMNMPNGSCMLASMATGEGKSLVGMMPSYYDRLGLTVVIVPTVSLAIDQYESAKKYFGDEVRAYHSGISYEEKTDIYRDLKLEKIKLLYISPEAVLYEKFKLELEELARKNLFNRLIIDEAHIVEDWGSQFRTEFQLLSVFRRKILKLGGNRLKTILLSATFTDSSVSLLKTLFSEDNNVIEIRGDTLRDEIQYYYSYCKNKGNKFQKLIEVLPYLPRPMIIYVLDPDYAEWILKKLKEENYILSNSFTGKTSPQRRKSILNDWNTNKIDIMVATSAFGMGVDKKNVRTVLHYSIPESINRFYQEVGRGGRDGLSSMSLLLSDVKEDLPEALGLVGNRALTVNKFIDRWNKMIHNQKKVYDGVFRIDMDIKPDYFDIDHEAGSLNRSWNEHVILQLYKYDLLDIVDISISDKVKTLDILINSNILLDMSRLESFLEENRDVILERNEFDKDEIRKFITEDINKRCMGVTLSNIYPRTDSLCNCCNYCVREKRISYKSEQTPVRVESGRDLIRQNKLEQESYGILDFMNIGLIYNSSLEENLDKILSLRFNHIVIAKDHNIKFFKKTYKSYCAINTFESIWEEAYPVSGTIGLTYTDNPEYNQLILDYSRELLLEGNKVIHIFKENFDIKNGDTVYNRIDADIIKQIK